MLSQNNRYIVLVMVVACVFSSEKASAKFDKADKPIQASQNKSLNRNASEKKVFQESKRSGGEFPPYIFKFSDRYFNYTVTDSGQGERQAKSSGIRSKFRLSYLGNSKDYYINAISYCDFFDDLLLICQISNGESAGGRIMRIRVDNLQVKWRTRIPAFNVGRGLVEENGAYIAGTGFVGKINLESGAYVWQHNNLLDLYGGFDLFDAPQTSERIVQFKEESYRSLPTRVIKLDKQSGKILSIKAAKRL